MHYIWEARAFLASAAVMEKKYKFISVHIFALKPAGMTRFLTFHLLATRRNPRVNSKLTFSVHSSYG
jgi:hypothetical protein